MALSEYTCVRKLCLALRHSGRDAFCRAIIFLLRSVTKYYSLTLKIITWTLQTRPRIDGVRQSVVQSRFPFAVRRSTSFVPRVFRSPFVVRRSPFAVPRSPFPVRRSPFAVPRSPFAVRRSSFVVRRSPFVVHRSPFPGPRPSTKWVWSAHVTR